jgi:deoxyxylulose-5-phosphate synthase
VATLFGRPAPELAQAMMEAYRADVLVDSGKRTVFRCGPMSGYPSRAASPPDVIENSHASTALSH